MQPKHLLATYEEYGDDISFNIVAFDPALRDDPTWSKQDFPGMATEESWTGQRWDYYTQANGKFSVQNNTKIVIHKDNRTFLSDFYFAERPIHHMGFYYPHWTSNPLSVDNPRRKSGKYIPGVKSEDLFSNFQFSDDNISFLYTGPDSDGSEDGDFYIAYDLYLIKYGSRGIPYDKDYLWIGPIIRNDGSPP